MLAPRQNVSTRQPGANRAARSIAKIAPIRHDELQAMGMAQQNIQDLDSLLLNAPLPVGGKGHSTAAL